MKYFTLFVVIFCTMGAGWTEYETSANIQPYYTLEYVPVVKQEIFMVLIFNGEEFCYEVSTRWKPQPVPWDHDEYTQWLSSRYKHAETGY